MDAKKVSERCTVIRKAIGLLQTAEIDARLSELWRGGERTYMIVMTNVHDLGIEETDAHAMADKV